MSLLALIAALSLEQFHPYVMRGRWSAWLASYLHFFPKNFNAGQHQHGKIAWFLAVLPVLLLVSLLYWMLHEIHPLLAWLLNVVGLYLVMGLRRGSDQYSAIQQALREDKLEEARRLLAVWRSVSVHELNAEQVARLTIEQGLLAAQRTVFGVMVWFVLFSMLGLAGAAGALLYRLAHHLSASWHDEHGADRFSDFARQAATVMDWLPTRLSAITYAIVGNFEDTLYCWRSQAQHWPDRDEGIVLASAAGSLGVRLGMDLAQDGQVLHRPELGLGEDADPEVMQSAVSLVWRSIVMWMIVLLMFSLANLMG